MAASDAINAHILSLGGQVEVSSGAFNPYQTSISSTNYNKLPVLQQDRMKDNIDTYDPTMVTNEINKIHNERMVRNPSMLN
jgi:hypothetical protein